MGALEVGCYARMMGLKKETCYNGRCGQILGVGNDGKCKVKTIPDRKIVNAPRQNLEAVAESDIMKHFVETVVVAGVAMKIKGTTQRMIVIINGFARGRLAQ